jgi:pilus assembly protein Flp/PilA
MRKVFKKLLRDDTGATAIEYGLIAALIAVAIISGVSAVGSKLSANFNSVQTSLK